MSVIDKELKWRFGAEPPAMGDFYDFLIKITYFKAYLSLNFCFKTYSDDSRTLKRISK